ncbi:MAG TPA: serine hydrolase, partial [Kofleriaceae bacterium]|nr:serine hydrolase [Kofleriaceae bacterium]
ERRAALALSLVLAPALAVALGGCTPDAPESAPRDTRPDLTAAPAAAPAAAAGSLDGLWEAVRRFGPDVRGTLTIERRAGAWRAAIAGHAAPVRVSGPEVTFALADQLGSFAGRLDTSGDRIVGHWTQPGGVRTGGAPFASPVTLVVADATATITTAATTTRTATARDGDGRRWRGEVRPLDDHMTLHLVIRTRGAISAAFLRNPERNIGAFMDVSRVVRRGDDIDLVGRARGADRDQVLATGHLDRDSDTLSIGIPARGGTYDFHRADGETDGGFYPRGARPGRYVYTPPEPLADGWPVAPADAVGIDRAAIERFVQKLIDAPIDSVHAPDIHAFLVARRGVLVVEEYFHGHHRDEPHDLRSAAKSITSVLVGAAIQAGAPLAASTPVYQAVRRGPTPLEPRRRALALEHLLTMSPGLACDDRDPDSPGNEERMQSQTAEPDWWRYTLALPMVRDPGGRAVYCSASANLVGAVLRAATGESLPRLFDRLIAAPLAIRLYHMSVTPTGEAYMGGGVHLLPRDFMKLGQMMLDGGVWRGARIVSREWAARSTAPVMAAIEGGGARPGIRYGYLWWVVDLPYRGRTVRAFYAAGNGGQVLMGIPEQGLLVCFLAGNYSDKVGLRTQQVLVPEEVLPAVADSRAR